MLRSRLNMHGANLFERRRALLRVRMILAANEKLDQEKKSKDTPPYEVIADADGNPTIIKVQF